MRPIYVFGLILWRGGLLLAGATALVLTARWLLRFIDLPLQLELGVGIVAAGVVLVLVSLILERARALREEEGLSE
jgi:hypothetical protein